MQLIETKVLCLVHLSSNNFLFTAYEISSYCCPLCYKHRHQTLILLWLYCIKIYLYILVYLNSVYTYARARKTAGKLFMGFFFFLNFSYVDVFSSFLLICRASINNRQLKPSAFTSGITVCLSSCNACICIIMCKLYYCTRVAFCATSVYCKFA